MKRIGLVTGLALLGSALLAGVAYGAAPETFDGFLEGCCAFLRGLWGGEG